MSYKTYGNIRDFVQQKLDLQEESFIQPSELLLYCEEAIKYCEAEIHKLNIEDLYFESQAPLAFVAGRSDYDLPSTIYAHKITRMAYKSGTAAFPIDRLTKRQRYEESVEIQSNAATGRMWNYMIFNHDPRSGSKIRIFPTPQETSTVTSITGTLVGGSRVVSAVSSVTGLSVGDFITGTGIPNGTRLEAIGTTTITLSAEAITAGAAVALTVTEPKVIVWFIRRAQIPAATTDLIDMPEFWNFVAQHMIVECLKKELGNPRVVDEKEKLAQMREQVLSTLANMVPDQNDSIEKDTTIYDDMDVSGGIY
jgi:hypothetical protein